jgi:hypothetical protein
MDPVDAFLAETYQESFKVEGMPICMYITDFRLYNIYENGLNSVKNKCND